MAQTLGSPALTAAYLRRVQSSHDFRIEVDILTMEERQVGSARFLDGQVNFNESHPRRTASFTLAEPAGALNFSEGSAFSGTAVWANRLLRVRHVVSVPGYGEVTAIPFIGVPTAMSRNGGEVTVECADKSALAMTGCAPYTVSVGGSAHGAIQTILKVCTGEQSLRVPASTRRLSRSYAVGWDDSTSPLLVCEQIAARELGSQIFWSNDGYATVRPLPTSPVVDFGRVTAPADTKVDFTQVKNYVSVTSAGKATSIAQPAADSTISAEYLARNGVVRWLPLMIDESTYTTTAQTSARAQQELAAASLSEDVNASVVPLFHLDVDDLGTLTADDQTRTVRLSSGAFGLGVGGDSEGGADMSIGSKAWVSKRVAPRVYSKAAGKR